MTHDFWTRTGGWEFDRSHVAGTSSPSHWQQVEEQAPKPVGWMMCFLLMTFVPVQKLCVNIYMYMYIYIYIYIYMHVLYEFCYRTYIYIPYNRSVIQYWWSCTPSHSIGLYFWGVRGSWVEFHFLFSLVYQMCLVCVYFDICNYICLDTSYHFSPLSLLLKYSLFFSSTPVLTSSIDVVFILSMEIFIGL